MPVLQSASYWCYGQRLALILVQPDSTASMLCIGVNAVGGILPGTSRYLFWMHMCAMCLITRFSCITTAVATWKFISCGLHNSLSCARVGWYRELREDMAPDTSFPIGKSCRACISHPSRSMLQNGKSSRQAKHYRIYHIIYRSTDSLEVSGKIDK